MVGYGGNMVGLEWRMWLWTLVGEGFEFDNGNDKVDIQSSIKG